MTTPEYNTIKPSARAERSHGKKNRRKFSSIMAMVLGAIVTIEIMIMGAMVLKLDFHSAFAVLTIVVSSLYTEHVFRTFVSYIGSISYLMYDKTGQIIQKQIYVRFYAEKLIFLTFQFPLSKYRG